MNDVAVAPEQPASATASRHAVRESTRVFPCGDEHLLGIVSEPDGTPDSDAAPVLGALIVVGGPQYRVGSHRQFTYWARAMAAAGIPALRFDVRGMGDSTGAPRAFTELGDDIAAALDAFQVHRPSLQGVVLCALCDGASAALLYLHERRDPRVAGLVLLNPWVRSEQTLARAMVRHYYLQRLLDRGFWAKLLKGQVAVRAISELWGHWRRSRLEATPATPQGRSASEAALPYTARMALGLERAGRPLLLVLSGEDLTAKEFSEHVASSPQWQGALASVPLERLDLPNADHTLSDPADLERLHAACLTWWSRLAQPPGGTQR